jgi:hypothetical protein
LNFLQKNEVALLAAGSAAAPSVSFSGDADTGALNPGTNQYAIATGGAVRFLVDASSYVGVNTLTPARQFEVASLNNHMRFSVPGDATAYYDFGRDNTDGLFFFNGAQPAFVGYKWLVNGAERLRLSATGQLQSGSGTAAAPAYSFSGDTNTGLFQPAADTLAVTVGGAEVARFGANGLQSASPWVDLASAATTDLGAQTSDNLRITGTTPITSFGVAPNGVTRHLRFAGVTTITYNATNLITPGLANITTAAGDTATAISLGSGTWVVTDYMRALAFNTYQQIQQQTVSAVSAVDFTLPVGFRRFELRIDGGRVATAGQSLVLRCGVGATFDAGALNYTWASLTHLTNVPSSGVVDGTAIDLTGGLSASETRSSITMEIDPGSASGHFQIRSLGGVIENSVPSPRVVNRYGFRVAVGAKDAIRILASGGANVSGTFTLLGIPS